MRDEEHVAIGCVAVLLDEWLSSARSRCYFIRGKIETIHTQSGHNATFNLHSTKPPRYAYLRAVSSINK